MAVDGNSLVATARCTVPTECLDSSGGQTFGFRSAGYETCAPFLDVPFLFKTACSQPRSRRRRPSTGARPSPARPFMRATAASRLHRCRRRGLVPHRPTRRRACHPQAHRHYRRCHQQKRPQHAILTTLAGTLSGADARAPDAVVDAVARPFLSAFTIPTPRPTQSFAPTRVPTTTPSSLPYPAPSPVPSTSFAPTTAGRPSLRPTRMPTPIPSPGCPRRPRRQHKRA